MVVLDEESGVLTKTAVFTKAGDVTLANSGDDLNLVLKEGSVISGTLSLGELTQGSTTGTITLSDGTDSFVETFLLEADSGSYSFVISQSSDADDTFGVDVGTYSLTVDVPQFQQVVVENLTISSSSSSLENLVVEVEADVAQATLTPSTLGLEAGSTQSMSLVVDLFVESGNALDFFEFSFVAGESATGSFDAISGVTSITMGNTSLDSSVFSAVSDVYTVDLSGVTPAENLIITFDLSAGATQDGLFSIDNRLVAEGGFETVAYRPESIGSDPLINVGAFLSFLIDELPGAFLGATYEQNLAASATLFVDTSRITDDLVFEWVIDSELATGDMITGTTGGVLGGTPLVTNRDGYSIQVTVSGNGYSSTETFTLKVYRNGFGVTHIEPSVVPTSGGEMIVKGEGFTLNSEVTLGTDTSVSMTFVNTETLKVTVPALEAATYSVTVEDSGDFAGLPNPVNDTELTVAQAQTVVDTVSPTIYGDVASVLDYQIVGIRDFYQGSIRSLFEEAYGPYDIQSYRVFGYDQGYYELDSLTIDNTVALRPGTAFWLISRISGEMSKEAVPASSVDSYTVAVPAESWALVSNVYSDVVTWTDVTILGGDVTAPIIRTVSSDRSSDDPMLNANLYAMDNEAEDLTRPYQTSDFLLPGQGYWVQNKSGEVVVLKITKPVEPVVGKLSKASAKPYFKSGEDQPPIAPVSFGNEASIGGSGGGGGGGGCLLD